MKLKTFYVIECQKKFTGKANSRKIKASGFTDALLRFKKKRLLDRLPYSTIIACEELNHAVFYPKGVSGTYSPTEGLVAIAKLEIKNEMMRNSKLQRIVDCAKELDFEFIIRAITPFMAKYCLFSIDAKKEDELNQIKKLKNLQQLIAEQEE